MKKYSIENAINLALSRGGKCLSTEYVNSDTKLLWECNNGHQWYAKWDSINGTGTWCAVCAGKKFTLWSATKLAHKQGGRCLSNEFIDRNSDMSLECDQGHKWEASVIKIQKLLAKKNDWCPDCAKNKRLDYVISVKTNKINILQETARIRCI